MFILIFLILGILILVLQTTFLQLLPAWLGSPDILFLLIVYISCQADIFRGAFVILLLGLLMDAFSHDVISRIKQTSLHDRISDLVSKRLRGELSRCNNCAMNCND